jgi:hypothetical protein
MARRPHRAAPGNRAMVARMHGHPPALAVLSCLLLATACASGTAKDTVADRAPEALAARLPGELAGFQRRETTALTPGDGRSVAYATPGLRAAAAVVDLSVMPPAAETGRLVPEGLDSPAAATALADMLEEAARPGSARSLHAQGRLDLPAVGATPLLRCAETAGRYGRERVQGLLCAGVPREGVLLRLRVVMPQVDAPPADARAFASGIAAALQHRGG